MNGLRPVLAVTGATGFLGSRVLQLARNLGWRVRVVTRAPQAELFPRLEIVTCGYHDVDQLRCAFEGADVVLHCAGLAHVFGPEAKNANTLLKANEEAASNSALAARRAATPHFILVSSVSVYGTYEGSVANERTPCHPTGPYARSKLAGEQRASDNLAGSLTALTILRAATLYGEGDRGNIAKLLHALGKGHSILPGSGRNKKSLLYVGDAARACMTVAGSAAIPGERNIYNVSAKPVNMLAIVEVIAILLHRKVLWLPVPDTLLAMLASMMQRSKQFHGMASMLQTFLREDGYSADLFEKTYRFQCVTGLSEGLRRQAAADSTLRTCS